MKVVEFKFNQFVTELPGYTEAQLYCMIQLPQCLVTMTESNRYSVVISEYDFKDADEHPANIYETCIVHSAIFVFKRLND